MVAETCEQEEVMSMKTLAMSLCVTVLLLIDTRALADCSTQQWTFSNGKATTCAGVGIGTDTPSAWGSLHIYGVANNDLYAGMGVDLMYGPAFNFGYAGASFGRSSGFFNVRPDTSAVPPNPSLRFMTANIQRMMIDNNGQVTINDSNGVAPSNAAATDRLVVNGTIRGTSVVATFQDVAEWVPASVAMVPGTVVVLNMNKANEVMPSSAAYDTTVAGVVSAQPGVILGEASAGKAKIATTGRVRVRADASRTPIRIGDLLVTSDMPGVAMRSEPMQINGRKFHQPGTIIGKALEPLSNGTGEILVLLSLQ